MSAARVAAHLTTCEGRPSIVVEIIERDGVAELRLDLKAAQNLCDVIEQALNAAELALADVGMRQ